MAHTFLHRRGLGSLALLPLIMSKLGLYSLSPEEHAAHLAALDKPQSWNPKAPPPTEEEVAAVRFRAEKILDAIARGRGGEARQQRLLLDLQAAWN